MKLGENGRKGSRSIVRCLQRDRLRLGERLVKLVEHGGEIVGVSND